jgi:surface glycoprotein (TIGR04207 family)
MNKRNLFVRITAIFLCALMVLSVVTAALYAFAAEPAVVASPDTGSESMVWVIVAAVAAVAVIIGCLVMPKMKKK